MIKQWVRVCLLALVSLVWAGGAMAVTTVFRCVKDGQTVLTDKPRNPVLSVSSSIGSNSGSESKSIQAITALPTLVGDTARRRFPLALVGSLCAIDQSDSPYKFQISRLRAHSKLLTRGRTNLANVT